LGGSSSSAAAAPPPPPQPASEIAPSEWSIDESAPSTSIQLRLRDGSRKVARFNLSHTVSDIRAYIAAAAPACASGEYTLQLAGFPPKRLTDGAMKIGDGGLASSVVIQR
jgi:UBX domain-containing protein 1